VPWFDEATEARLARSAWVSVSRVALSPRVGAHDAVLGIALVAAVGAIQAGAGEVLVVDRASAIVLERW
jgi:hypothetical protein